MDTILKENERFRILLKEHKAMVQRLQAQLEQVLHPGGHLSKSMAMEAGNQTLQKLDATGDT